MMKFVKAAEKRNHVMDSQFQCHQKPILHAITRLHNCYNFPKEYKLFMYQELGKTELCNNW